ncbi:MAG: hypothetical protein IJK41_02945 [Muribaculaceae bacterium]|nr:hypothetical protein [Muribaculaceae bacterium]
MIKTRSIRILAAVLLVAGFTVPVTHANNQLTVADGTDLSYSSPINFVWVDTQGIRTQVLYPAEELSDMRDEPINSVTFYISGGCGTSGGRLRVSVGETEQTSLGPYVSALTQVATISLTQGVTELTINFDNPYLYHGSNLVIETVVEEETEYCESHFYGTRTSFFATITRNEIERFMPKATFDYGTNEDYAAKVYPYALDFNTIRAGKVDAQTLVLKNIGQLPFTPTFSVTSPYIIASPPKTLVSGASMEVYVHFVPEVMGYYPGTLTIDCGAAGEFEIPLHGTALRTADYLTVCESDDYTTYLPLDGLYMNMIGTEGQMIYPAAMLTAMQGSEILAIDFHAKRLRMNNGEITMSLKVTDNDGFADMPVLETGLTPVAVTTPVKGETMLSFMLDEPFVYNGGNLLIDVKVTVAGDKIYNMSSFYGTPMDYNASMDVYTDDCVNYWKEAVPFLPMVTFSYSQQEQPQQLRGDVDGDGQVNISDISALIDYLLNNDETGVNPQSADVDLDGTTTISDISSLIDYLLNGVWS